MATIPLTKGKVAIVDDADFEAMTAHNWCALGPMKNGAFYAVRSTRDGARKRQVLMHRVIGRAATGQEVDHWNGDGLDNRRANLRPCSSQQNKGNTRTRSKSGFKGVTWHKRAGKWMAQIGVNYTVRCLGYFDKPDDAARAYDAAALKHFGRFARPNFKNESEATCGTQS